VEALETLPFRVNFNLSNIGGGQSYSAIVSHYVLYKAQLRKVNKRRTKVTRGFSGVQGVSQLKKKRDNQSRHS